MILGYIGPPTQPFLARLIREYRQRYPLVAVQLQERTPERIWEMVAKGRLSVALTRPVPGHESFGLNTVVLREEPLGIAVPLEHPLARRRSVPWTALKSEPLIVLARREGTGLYDAVLAGCREAGFAPRLAQTPSLIGTVLTYVEAHGGIGVVTDSVMVNSAALKFVPLKPRKRVPLVLAWRANDDSPPLQSFRSLLLEWKRTNNLWLRAS